MNYSITLYFSIFGCPKAAILNKESKVNGICPYPGCNGEGSIYADQTTHKTLNTCPNINIEHERSCPIEGCDGKGHRSGSGKYTTHRT